MNFIKKCTTFIKRLWQVNEITPIQEQLTGYHEFYRTHGGECVEDMLKRQKKHCAEIASRFYSLISPFYELGWGKSFHFYPRRKNESPDFSCRKVEYKYALKLQLKPGEQVIDLGCGIGQPARNIAEFSGAKITGITITPSQVVIARQMAKAEHLEHLCQFEEADMCNTPFSDSTFDKAYSLEGTIYVSSPTIVFGEVFRILKAGGLFLVQGDGLITDNYDHNNRLHRRLYEASCTTGGMVANRTFQQTRDALTKVGFSILDEEDLDLKSEVPIDDVGIPPRLLDFIFSFTLLFINILEFLHIVPKGTHESGQLLEENLACSRELYQHRLMSPFYVVVAQKPLNGIR